MVERGEGSLDNPGERDGGVRHLVGVRHGQLLHVLQW